MEHVYSDNRGEWDVPRLWALADLLPEVERDPDDFPEWDEYSWELDLTLRGIADHLQRALDADLDYPIILSAEGRVMDGLHRLLKAKITKVMVRVVQFKVTPPPDRMGGGNT